MGSHLSKTGDTNPNITRSDAKSKSVNINSRRRSSVDSVATPEYITSTTIKAIGGNTETKQQTVGHRSDQKIAIPAEIVVVSDGSVNQDIQQTFTFPPSFKPLIPIGHESLSHSYPQLKPKYVINFGLIVEKHLKNKSEFVSKEQQKLVDQIRDVDSIVSYISNQFIIERQKRLIKVSENLSKIDEISTLIEKCDKDIDNCVENLQKLNQFLPKSLALEKFEFKTTH